MSVPEIFRILDELPTGAIIVGRSHDPAEWRIRFVNTRFCASTGWLSRDLVGAPTQSVWITEPAFLERHRHDDPDWCWSGPLLTQCFDRPASMALWQVIAVHDPSLGEPACLFVQRASDDVPDAASAANALRTHPAPSQPVSTLSNDLLAQIVCVTTDAIVVVDRDLRIIEFNDGAVAMFGYERRDITGRPLDILVPPDKRRDHATHMRNFDLSGASARMMTERGEVSGVRRDGSTFPCQASILRIGDGADVYHAAILRDRTERHRIEAELRDALDHARQSNEAKDRFFATVSHELRTPLNAIIGFSDIIRSELTGPAGNPKYPDYASDIYAAGVYLLEIVNKIMDISSIDAGQIRQETSEFDLRELVDDIIGTMTFAARNKLLDVSVDVADGLQLRADRRILRQTLVNLIDNAIKFSDRPGNIDVTARIEPDGMLGLSVADRGIGIPEDERAAVLEPFFQVDSSKTRHHQGIGLGLSLVKRFAGLYGGALDIAANPDRGTTATVRLPASIIV
jgi:PAS domain S-box-containing protein